MVSSHLGEALPHPRETLERGFPFPSPHCPVGACSKKARPLSSPQPTCWGTPAARAWGQLCRQKRQSWKCYDAL